MEIAAKMNVTQMTYFLCVLSHAQLFATLGAVACQAPLSMEFSGKNTGVGFCFLLQEIFLT